MRMIILVAHNLRSAHNVGSLLRTADGLGIDQVVLSGYTPYPQLDHDDRLPHISRKVSAQIHKTALGAEASVQWTHAADIAAVMQQLSGEGFTVAALEQAPGSQDLTAFTPPF